MDLCPGAPDDGVTPALVLRQSTFQRSLHVVAPGDLMSKRLLAESLDYLLVPPFQLGKPRAEPLDVLRLNPAKDEQQHLQRPRQF